jgi:hypothetical protein
MTGKFQCSVSSGNTGDSFFVFVALWSTVSACYGARAQGNPCTPKISDLLCVPIWVIIILDSSAGDLWQLLAETSSSEAGECCDKRLLNVAYVVSLSSLIRTVVIHGAELWVLTRKDELQLAVFERKAPRKIFGPIRDTNQCRKR